MPMSMPLYTCMLSAETTSPSNRAASSSAKADLPLAVQPKTVITGSSLLNDLALQIPGLRLVDKDVDKLADKLVDALAGRNRSMDRLVFRAFT